MSVLVWTWHGSVLFLWFLRGNPLPGNNSHLVSCPWKWFTHNY